LYILNINQDDFYIDRYSVKIKKFLKICGNIRKDIEKMLNMKSINKAQIFKFMNKKKFFEK